MNNPLATRFELRSPNPKSDTYLVIAASYLAMLDGIRAALENQKTPSELEKSLSKAYGEADFYLEKDREYRSEKDVFIDYTAEERDRLFGKVPRTVWENLCSFEKYPEKVKVFMQDDVMTSPTLESFKEAILAQWATELHNRIIPNTMDLVRECKKLHDDGDCTNFDISNWQEIQLMRIDLAQDSIKEKSLLTRIKIALDTQDYDTASDLQIEMQGAVEKLVDAYVSYKKNLF